jgi:putative methyltransferase (TIGR04325 family)
MRGAKIVRTLLPPILVGPARRLFGFAQRFVGPFDDWQSAIRASGGYAAPDILERAIAATRAVVDGRAAFERDSVLFDSHDYRYPIVAALMRTAARAKGRLSVIDLGGSLGSTYWQCRHWLTGLEAVQWVVVEQPSYVAAGRREFPSGPLRFTSSIDEAAMWTHSPLVLASSVLQYLESPTEAVDWLTINDVSGVLIDRTPLSDAVEHELFVQHVPRRVYRASYPCWIMSRSKLMAHLSSQLRLISEFPCDEGIARTSTGLKFEFRGLYLERQK